jgi:hypothetical protein
MYPNESPQQPTDQPQNEPAPVGPQPPAQPEVTPQVPTPDASAQQAPAASQQYPPVQPAPVMSESSTPPAMDVAPTPPAAFPQPTPATSAQPAAFAQPPMQPAPKKSHMGLILGLVGGGVALLAVIIIGIFLFINAFSVSKADYAAASTKLDEVRNAYNDMSGVYISSSSSKTVLQNGLDTLKTARTKFNTAYTELGQEKAVKNDADMNKLFKAAEAKKPKFDAAMDMTVEAYEKIALPTAGLEVSNISDLTSVRDAYAAISGLKNAQNKQYVDTVTGIMQKIVPLAAKVQAGRADYRKYDSAALKQYYQLADDLTTASNDWQSNIEKAAKDGELSDELNALSTPLFEKSLGKS